MSRELDQKYEDVRIWMENNCNRYPIVDQQKRWEFTLKAFESIMHLLAYAILDIRELEHREKIVQRSRLYLPDGFEITDGRKNEASR